jgi:hypothetical protein
MSLPLPHFRTAFGTAVALATVAADTDCEYGAASRVTANPKPKNSVLVDVHVGHKEIMPSRTGAELKLSASATGAHWLLKGASPPGSGYAAIQQQSESWMCVD